ncbi:MAG: antitoxin VbhA family protein [Clostridium sp.]|nr:antitoxin VbhA family protein [Clostridium sp.]
MNNEKVNHIIEEVKATQAIEGLTVTKQEEAICRKYLQGKLTEDEAIKEVDKLLNIKRDDN